MKITQHNKFNHEVTYFWLQKLFILLCCRDLIVDSLYVLSEKDKINMIVEEYMNLWGCYKHKNQASALVSIEECAYLTSLGIAILRSVCMCVCIMQYNSITINTCYCKNFSNIICWITQTAIISRANSP